MMLSNVFGRPLKTMSLCNCYLLMTVAFRAPLSNTFAFALHYERLSSDLSSKEKRDVYVHFAICSIGC